MGAEMLWVEKYRPDSLDDVAGQDEVTSRLKAYVEEGSLPHLLFAGPAGTGKTTSSIAIAKELWGDDWKQNFQELNASDERGIDVVRTKIKDFARTAPLGDVDFKIIFLDEADSLTSEAQAALRRTMEQYSNTCRFILSCNYSSKIIDPIQSRCAVFRFRTIADEDVADYIRGIADDEGVEVTDAAVDAITYVAGGDMRRALNALQVASSTKDTVDEEDIYQSTATARPEEVERMLETALEGNFLKAREILDDLLIEYGLSGEDVVKQVHKTVYDLGVPDDAKVRLVDRIGEADFRLVEGANEHIQIESLLAHFSVVGDSLH